MPAAFLKWASEICRTRPAPRKFAALDGTWRGVFEGYWATLVIRETATGYSGHFEMLDVMEFSMVEKTDGSVVTTMGDRSARAGTTGQMAAEDTLWYLMAAVTNISFPNPNLVEMSGAKGSWSVRLHKWIDDGSGRTESFDTTVATHWWWYSGKVNAQYSHGVRSGSHYWEVDVDSSKMTLGLTSVQSFRNKSNIRGYFYDYTGNLVNGASALRTGFGPAVSVGDKIGMIVEFTDKMRVWYFLNDVCLGLAYSVPIPFLAVYPTVSFKSGNSAATISRVQFAPNRIPDVEHLMTFEGVPVRLKLQETNDGYSGHFEIANVVTFVMANRPNGLVVTTFIGQTQKGGPPEQTAAEATLRSFIASVTRITVTHVAVGHTMLTFTGRDASVLEFLTSASVTNDEYFGTFEGVLATLKLQETSEGYSGNFGIRNTFNFIMVGQPDGSVVTTLVGRTDIPASQAETAAEANLNTFMQSVTRVTLGQGAVALTGGDGTVLHFLGTTAPAPVETEVFVT